MIKITAIVSLMLIATWSQAVSRRNKRDSQPSDFDTGSTLWAAGLSCDSCGSECASACGTRHFRSCCFNYLRKKRGSDAVKLWSQSQDGKDQQERLPIFTMKAEPWYSNLLTNNYKLNPYEDTPENHFQVVYDV